MVATQGGARSFGKGRRDRNKGGRMSFRERFSTGGQEDAATGNDLLCAWDVGGLRTTEVKSTAREEWRPGEEVGEGNAGSGSNQAMEMRASRTAGGLSFQESFWSERTALFPTPAVHRQTLDCEMKSIITDDALSRGN